MNIKTIVNAYMRCGEAAGFFIAEMILLKYLPKTNPDGRCCDVAQRKRQAFYDELVAQTKEAQGTTLNENV